jgi:uridine phosphorylase
MKIFILSIFLLISPKTFSSESIDNLINPPSVIFKDIWLNESNLQTVELAKLWLDDFDKENALEDELLCAITEQTNYPNSAPKPYMVKGSDVLIDKLSSEETIKGITVTANGFYGPQGRQLRLVPKIEQFNEKLSAFKHNNHIVSNLEMETSALYGLGKLLEHNCATICVILANRYTKTFTKDYDKVIDQLIQYVLKRLTH